MVSSGLMNFASRLISYIFVVVIVDGEAVIPKKN